jgi:uncharacterized membrane protein
MHYFPVTLPFLLLLFFLFLLVIILIEIGILEYAYQRIGIDRRYMFMLLFLSLMGSYINIPVAHLPPEELIQPRVVSFFGIRYVVPLVINTPGTIIAVNLGGAVIPVILSVYLILKNKFYTKGLLAIGLMAALSYHLATPVPGVGIALPSFLPPLVTAGIALLLSKKHAPSLAYVAGSMGTLIGADLLNLGKIQGLGAPVASIGGAGTFDGIFLNAIVAVLLSSVMTKKEAGVSR